MPQELSISQLAVNVMTQRHAYEEALALAGVDSERVNNAERVWKEAAFALNNALATTGQEETGVGELVRGMISRRTGGLTAEEIDVKIQEHLNKQRQRVRGITGVVESVSNPFQSESVRNR